MSSTMSFGRILAQNNNNSLDASLHNVLALHKATYIESLVRGGVDLRNTIGDRRVVDKRLYPTRRLFYSVDSCSHVGKRLPTIIDVLELPEVHTQRNITSQ